MVSLLCAGLCVGLAFAEDAGSGVLPAVESVRIDDRLVAPERWQSAMSTTGPSLELGWDSSLAVTYGFQGRGVARLRHRLDANGEGWQEPAGSASLQLQAYDPAGRLLSAESVGFRGESPGWTGDAADSPIREGSLQLLLPPRASQLAVRIITSSGTPETIGIMSIGHLALSFSDHGGDRLDLMAMAPSPPPAAGEWTPARWLAAGAGLKLCRTAFRSDGTQVLILRDDDIVAHAAW